MVDSPNIGELLANARERLAGNSDTPSLDSQVLLAHTLSKPRSWIYAHPEFQPSTAELKAYEQDLRSLEQGKPLPYILGSWEFYGLQFLVTPAVLIPRPETELLVERALDWLNNYPEKRVVVDVGTGSGCIAICLAVKVPNLRVLASDTSLPALKVARANAVLHHVSDRVHFIQANLLPSTAIPFDLVCANLPYVPASRLPKLKIYQKEPVRALDGGPQGLELIVRLLTSLPSRISHSGSALLEIDVSQRESMESLAISLFPGANICVQQDLAGRDRLLVIDLPA